MLNKAFLGRVARFVSDGKLLDKAGKYIVALSGGADSVALLLSLKDLGYDVEAAHCNFHLRGEESDRDECFCRDLCKVNGIPFHLTHFDTVGFAKLRKQSIEMSARNLRYAYFKSLMDAIGASAVCVAHHQDDSVETVLMNLVRGTGLHGLAGIKARNGYVVRPLLCVRRKDIEAVLDEAGQGYVTDSTNLVDDVVRNKIRLDVMPLLEAINPSVSDSIAKTARIVDEAVKVIDTLNREASARIVSTDDRGAVKLNLNMLMAETSPATVLFGLLKDYSFNSSQAEQILHSVSNEPGHVFYSPTHQLLVDRQDIVIEPLPTEKPRAIVVPETGVYVYSDTLKFKIEDLPYSAGFEIKKDCTCCYADKSKVMFPLTIRPVTVGDRFVPFGMKGQKLVSDFLTDRKMNLFDKRRQLAVLDSSGCLVWLVNLRPDERFRVTDKTTGIIKITCM